MLNFDSDRAILLAPIEDIRKAFLSGLKFAARGLERDIKGSPHSATRGRKSTPLKFFDWYCGKISSSLTEDSLQRLIASVFARRGDDLETSADVYIEMVGEDKIKNPPINPKHIVTCAYATRIVLCFLWAEGLVVLPRRVSSFKAPCREMQIIAEEKAPSKFLYKVMAVNAASEMEFSGPVREEIRYLITSHWVRLLWSTNWTHPDNVSSEDIRVLIENASAQGIARFYVLDFMTYLFDGYEGPLAVYQQLLKEAEDKRLARKADKKKESVEKRNQYKKLWAENRKKALSGSERSEGQSGNRAAWDAAEIRKNHLTSFARGNGDKALEVLIEENFTPTNMRGIFFEPDLNMKEHFLYSALGEKEQALIKLIDTTFKGYIHSKALMKTAQHEYVLILLLSYVSVYLPNFFWRRDGSLERFPTTFNNFTCAYYIANNEHIASLINQGEDAPLTFFKYLEVIGKKFDWSWSDTAYAHFKTTQGYFEYIESLSSAIPDAERFICTITESNLPRTQRRVTTAKNVLPREYFRVFISLLETLDYLVDHINGMADGSNPGLIGPRLVSPTYSELIHHGAWSSIWGLEGMDRSDIKVESLNYTPVVRYENRYYPLRRIKRFYTLTPYRVNGVDETRATPHVPRIMWLMANTGIRQKHLIWLNKDEFDAAVTSKLSGLAPLIVSTDKAHSEWVSIVSGEVIEVCRRQRNWLEGNEIESLKEPMWYSGTKNNRFGKFIPLFRLDSSPSGWDIWEDSAKIMWMLDRFLREEAGEDGFPELAYWQPTIKSKTPGALEDHIQTLDKFSKTDVNLSWGWKLRSKYTPHGLRAAFVSDHIRFLPPSLIGRHLTGQFSEALVWYYTVMDAEDIGSHEQLLINLLMRNEEAIRDGGAPELSQKIIDINAKLAKDITEDPDSAISAHGLFSLSDVAESENGIAALKAKKYTHLAFNSTHICPFNNTCPSEVIKNFGLDKPCSICPYAIRGAMHLPAINAQKFKYLEVMEEYGEKIKELRKRPKHAVMKSDIEEMEAEYDLLVRDAFALEAIEQQLYHLRATDVDGFMAGDAESIKELYSNLVLSGNEHFIKRLVDMQCFPNLDSPALQRQCAHMRLKLQVATGNLAAALTSHEEPENVQLVSLIRSMMSVEGLSVREIFQIASSDLPDRVILNPTMKALGFENQSGLEALNVGKK